MKTNQFGFSMDTKRMMDDLILKFWETLDTTADELLLNMRSRAKDPAVIASLKKEIMKMAVTEIEIAVGSDHWKAFLDNYGTGSAMASESSNSDLVDYKSSKYWHEFRPTNVVTKRGTGFYTVPNWEKGDGEIVRFSSNSKIPAGTNLESVKWTKYNYKFKKTSPSFFLENAFTHISKVFEDRIYEVYDKFPFHKYIKGGG